MKIRIAAKVVPRPPFNKTQEEKKYTLEDIAIRICQSYPECTKECGGFKYCCRGKKGTIAWLHEIVGG